jgi:hypothetical protein
MTRCIVFHLPTDQQFRILYLREKSTSVYAVKTYSINRNGQTLFSRSYAELVHELIREEDHKESHQRALPLLAWNNNELRNRFCSLRFCRVTYEVWRTMRNNMEAHRTKEIDFLRSLCDNTSTTQLVIKCDEAVRVDIYADTADKQIISLLNLTWLCDLALALLQKDVAPYVVLDIFNMLLDTSMSNYETEAKRYHYKKIKMVEEVQRRLRLRLKTN